MISLFFAAALAFTPGPASPGAINPAVTQVNIAQTVCVSGWTTTIRPPASYTTALKKRQLAAMGVQINSAQVEEDHRVPLEIGGNPTDPANLWPEPWIGALGAHSKDRLENAVHRDLCAGRLPLQAAQAIFLGDWTKEYLARFRSGPEQ